MKYCVFVGVNLNIPVTSACCKYVYVRLIKNLVNFKKRVETSTFLGFSDSMAL